MGGLRKDPSVLHDTQFILLDQSHSGVASAAIVPVQPLLTTTACSVVCTTTASHFTGAMETATASPAAGILPPPNMDGSQQQANSPTSSSGNTQLPTVSEPPSHALGTVFIPTLLGVSPSTAGKKKTPGSAVT